MWAELLKRAMEDLEELENELHEAWQRGELDESFDVIGPEGPRSSRRFTRSLPTTRLLTVPVASGLVSVAAKRNHVEIIKFLGGRGADVTCLREPGAWPCPLNEACTWGHLQSAQALVELGARPTSEMLQSVLCGGFLPLAKYLVSQGSRIDVTQAEATLGAVCTKGDLATVQYIVTILKIQPTGFGFLGACLSRQSKVVLYLMTKGCAATAEVLGKNDVVIEAVGEALLGRVKVVNDTAIAVWRKLNLGCVNFNWFFHPSVSAQYVEVDLSDNNLRDIPIQLFSGELPFLMTLRLHHNQFRHLPQLHGFGLTEIRDIENSSEGSDDTSSLDSQGGVSLSRLTDLDVSFNDLRDIPKYIFELPSLAVLNLSHNWLRSLDPEDANNQEDLLFSISNVVNLDSEEITPIDEGNIQRGTDETHAGGGAQTETLGRSTASSDVGVSMGYSPTKWKCVHLEKLDVSHNALNSLPDDVAQLMLLRKLRVHHNHLTQLPTVWRSCPCLEELDAGCNFIESSPYLLAKIIPSWKNTMMYLDLSNNRLTEMPPEVCRLEALRCLLLSGNFLTEIPKYLKWTNMCLERLDVSHNFLGLVHSEDEGEVAVEIPTQCADGRQRPVLQNRPVSELEPLVSVSRLQQRRRSSSESCLSTLANQMPTESSLSLQRRLQVDPAFYRTVVSRSPLFEKKLKSVAPFFKAEGDQSATAEDDHFYLPANKLRELKHVDISFNRFEDVPLCLCNLCSLSSLILVGNSGILRLPLELSWRTLLWQLDVEGLSINFPQQLVHTRGSRGPYLPVKITLAYMSKLLRDERPDYFIKVVIVGDKKSGKTCLSQALCNPHSLAQMVPYQPSPPGVSFQEITIYPKGAIRSTTSNTNVGLECCFWEVTDLSVYSCLARTFFTRRTIHLLVWDTTKEDGGVESLREWLREIPKGDASSSVLIVGTHDEEDGGQPRRFLSPEEFQTGQHRAVSATVRVSSTNSWKSIESLRDVIYKTGRSCCERLSKVPKAYSDMRREFRERCSKKLIRDGHVPLVVTRESISNVLEGIEADLKWDREFVPATQYLQEVGQLLHFEDPFENLSQLYYTDLKLVFTKISTLATHRIMIETGTIEHDQAVNMLCDDRLHADMLPAFFRLMEKMGVAFPVTNHSVLVPTLLPSDRPNLTPELFLHPTQSCDSRVRASSDGDRPYELLPFKTVQRVYSLHSMPANFLCQLVARIKSSFDRWLSSRRRLTSGQRKRAGSASEMPYLGANHDRRYRSRIEVTQEIDTECWKYGLVSFYEGGYLLVESIDGLKRRNKRLELCGIQVTVAGDTSVLGFVIDQVETLLSDWFPEFVSAGLGGFQQLERIVLNRVLTPEIMAIPTTGVRKALPRAKPLAGSEEAHQFGFFVVEQCCVLWQFRDAMRCPETGQLILLKDLIPDVLIQDVPSEFLITEHELSFHPTEDNFVGYGGEADVYVHTFRGHPVAVKVYHSFSTGGDGSAKVDDSVTAASQLFAMLTSSTESFQHIDASFRNKRSLPASAVKRSKAAMQPATIGDDPCSLVVVSRGLSILDAFTKMRREVTFLLQLRHPCVVPLIGFCLRPLCLLTEYAPLGSLSAVLAQARLAELKARGPTVTADARQRHLFRDGVLGRALTWKIAFQVAHALQHLHLSKVVYQDLKSANVLFYSLDINTPINVKLTDYGIAQYLSLSGVKETKALGTPGFQAPEITQHGSRDRVFNEQADIFSFAMVLYELLTGHRPFAYTPFSALEIPEKISLGERPQLDTGYAVTRVVELMKRSWRQEAQDRPTAGQLIGEMKKESFVVQHRTLSIPRAVAVDHVCAAVDYVSAPPTNCLVDSRLDGIAAILQSPGHVGDQTILTRQTDVVQSGMLWAIGGSGNDRRFSVANAQTRRCQLKEISFPGPQVTCMASVDGRQMWLGVVQPSGIPEVHVYSSRGSEPCFTWEFQWKSRLDDTPRAILSQKCPDIEAWEHCVLLSLSGGSMTAFYGQESHANEFEEELLSSKSSLSDWKKTRRERTACHRDAIRREADQAPAYLPLIKDNYFSWDRHSFRAVSQDADPITCMTAVGLGEVWCAAGSQICVLSRRHSPLSHLARDAVFRLQGFQATRLVHLNGAVWISNDQQPWVWRYDVNTRSLTTALDCCKVLPSASFPCTVPSNFYSVRREAVADPTAHSSSSLHQPSFMQLRHSPTAAVCRVSAIGSPPEEAGPPNASAHLEAVLQGQQVSSQAPPVAPTLADGDVNEMYNIHAMAVVGDALWLGRQSGDILVVDGRKESGDLQVALGYLQPQRTSPLFGCPVRTLTPLACGLVVVGRQPRLEERFSTDFLPSKVYPDYFSLDRRHAGYNDEAVPLDVWEAWSSQEFNWFRCQQSHLE